MQPDRIEYELILREREVQALESIAKSLEQIAPAQNTIADNSRKA